MTLPRLLIEGNRLTTSAGAAAIALRGVNVSGLQHRRPEAGESWRHASGIDADLLPWLADHGATVVRVPLSQDWVLGRDHARAGEAYLDELDALVTQGNAAGMYVVLCLHCLGWRDAGASRQPYLPPLPDEDSVIFWRTLAARFGARPGVLFDLLNEPHGAPARAWHAWVRRLVGELLSDGGRGLLSQNTPVPLFVVSGIGGPCWSSDLSSFPVRESDDAASPPLPNLVYSSHIYRHGSRWRGRRGHTLNARGWSRLVDATARGYPVFVGEWGAGEELRDERWTRELLAFLDERGIGWAAWSVGDRPHIVDRARGPRALTTHGARVMAALRAGRRGVAMKPLRDAG
ncbi:MAG TPA: cellulase family glycosylhydrolase [Vicinamibacterales bacterium]|nr:cellulase family glycosylhydrolase [Vicinamibacterales bacterium]